MSTKIGGDMTKKFVIEFEYNDAPPVLPIRVTISGDEAGLPEWEKPFMRGVEEMLSLMEQLYGRELVQQTVKRYV
jgi:hypothetical protein